MSGGARPIDALNSHVALIRAFQVPGGFDVQYSGDRLWAAMHLDSAQIPGVGRMYADALDRAVTVVVTDRMLSLVLDRMDEVTFGQPMFADILPFPAGFVVLPRAVDVPNNDKDLDPSTMTNARPEHYQGFDACSWIPARIALRERGTEEGERVRLADWPEEASGLTYGLLASRSVVQSNIDDEYSPQQIEHAFAVHRLMHLPVYASGWAFGTSWNPADRDEDFILSTAGEFERRFWLSLWRTLDEEVLAPVRFPRAVNRRSARLRAHVPEVVVADLRRVKRSHREEDTDDGAVIMWSHRWRVREHPRTLHRGTPDERVIMVKEHIKGPAHLPLLEKDRVYRLKR